MAGFSAYKKLSDAMRRRAFFLLADARPYGLVMILTILERQAKAFQNKKTSRGIGEISDAFLDEKMIWKYPRNLSKPIVFFGKICYNWINPKNVDDTYRRAVLWQERNNRPCSGRKS